MELRPYQSDAIEAIRVAYRSGTPNQIIVLPTGSGKTVVAANIIKHFSKTLWITHNIELILQSKGVMEDFGFTTGIIKQERMEIGNDVTVASIQTLWRRLDKIDPNIFDLLIVDEVHHCSSRTWSLAFNHFNTKLKLGLTATPTRTDGMSLGDLFDQITYEYSIQDGIKDGFLCELDARRIRTSIDLNKVRTTAGELNQKDLRIIDCPERNNLIVDKYEEYAEDRPALAFCVDVEHVMNLSATFQNRGHRASFVVGDSNLCPDREHRISAFKNSDIDVMTNCMVLSEGFDYPDLACIIAACPTKSLTKYIQMIGRGTRLKKDFSDCIILDVVDVTTKHRLINTWTLDKGKEIKKKLFMTEKQKGEAVEREKVELEALKLTQKDRKIDLFAIPKMKQNFTSPNMRAPATQPQIDWLKKLGYEVDSTTFTKGMASEIISNLPATAKQMYTLRSKGYDVDDSLTRAESAACFDNMAERKGQVPEWKRKVEST